MIQMKTIIGLDANWQKVCRELSTQCYKKKFALSKNNL